MVVTGQFLNKPQNFFSKPIPFNPQQVIDFSHVLPIQSFKLNCHCSYMLLLGDFLITE